MCAVIVRLLSICNREFTDFIFQVVYNDCLYFFHHMGIIREELIVKCHHWETFREDCLRRHFYLLISQRHLLQRDNLYELLDVSSENQLKYFFEIYSLLFLTLSQISESFPLKFELVNFFQEICSIGQLQCFLKSLSNFHDLLLLCL